MPIANSTRTLAKMAIVAQDLTVLEQASETNSLTISRQNSALTPTILEELATNTNSLIISPNNSALNSTMGSQALMELMMTILNGEISPGTKFVMPAPAISDLLISVPPGMVATATL